MPIMSRNQNGTYDEIPYPADQVYNAASTNPQSGVAVAQALSDVPIVTVDQTYNASSTNPQSGTAVAGILGNIYSVLEEVL